MTLSEFVKRPCTFANLSSALRISTKYEIPTLRQWCVAELTSRWPREIETMGTTSLAHAAGKLTVFSGVHAIKRLITEAIILARECDVPDILPAAFYILSIQKWSAFAEGGYSHTMLPRSDLRRIIAGRERLNDITLSFALEMVPETYSHHICHSCLPHIVSFWRSILTPDPASPWGCWLLRDLTQKAPHEHHSHHWCADCTFQHNNLAWHRMNALKKAIPRIFMLD